MCHVISAFSEYHMHADDSVTAEQNAAIPPLSRPTGGENMVELGTDWLQRTYDASD